MSIRALAGTLLVGAVLAACGVGMEENVGETQAALDAVCTANVAGKKLAVESDYLPHVVMCENGGAPLEALKVQAIAARTFLYFKIETSGSIGDGQGDQVYSCGREPTAAVKEAVLATSGIVLRHGGVTLASFFVAGGKGTPPACVGGAASTEQYVTYNSGLSGADVKPTSLGSKSNPRNRGCMSQNGASCLANAGEKYESILRFYYGEDVQFERALGTCVEGPVSAPDAGPTMDAGADGGAVDPETGPGEASGCAVSGPQPRRAGEFAPFFLVFLLAMARRKGGRDAKKARKWDFSTLPAAGRLRAYADGSNRPFLS